MASAKYLKYLSDLNKTDNHDDDNLSKIYDKYYKNDDCISGASCFNTITLLMIDKLNIKDLKIALAYLNKIYPRMYDNDNTVKSYFSTIRTKLKNSHGIKSNQYLFSQDLMKQSVEIKQKLETEYKLKVKDKNRNKIVFYLEDVYDIIEEALASDNLFDQLAGLMLCSGARTKELIVDNKYSQHPTAKGYIIIKNIGKRREGQVNKFDSLERPLIKIIPETFIKRVNKLRKDISKEMDILVKKGNHEGELHQTISSNLKSACVRLFKRSDMIPKYLRKIYGNASYLLFVPDKDKFDKNTWLSDVLGHKDTDIATAASYTVINVIKCPISKITEKLQVNDNSYEINLNMQTLQNQINKLKEEVKAEKVEKTEEKEEKIKFTGNREQKEEHVKKIYKKMKTDKELISIRRLMAKSGISQKIVVETLNTIPNYIPNTFNTVK
jgi:hypothetical protein